MNYYKLNSIFGYIFVGIRHGGEERKHNTTIALFSRVLFVDSIMIYYLVL